MRSLESSISIRLSEGISRNEFTKQDIARYLNGDSIAYVFGVEINSGVPIIRHLEFGLNPDRSIRPELGVVTVPSIFYLKNNDSIRRVVPRDWIKTTDIAGFLRFLMNVGINADKINSGGLVSIVRIDAKQGIRWIEPGACLGDHTTKKK
jgi:hypothetical protein